jgi:hypothetical protein
LHTLVVAPPRIHDLEELIGEAQTGGVLSRPQLFWAAADFAAQPSRIAPNPAVSMFRPADDSKRGGHSRIDEKHSLPTVAKQRYATTIATTRKSLDRRTPSRLEALGLSLAAVTLIRYSAGEVLGRWESHDQADRIVFCGYVIAVTLLVSWRAIRTWHHRLRRAETC